MRVPLRKFLAFMRRLGPPAPKRKLTKRRAPLKPKVPNWRAQLLKLPQLSDEEVLATAKELVVKMGKYARTRNTPQSLATPEVWTHLFHSLDTDGSGRISYLEFEECARKMDVSEKMLQRGIKALWRLVDADGSGEATEKDFVLALYRLQLDRWPRLEQEDLERAMVILNAAADKWHRAGGNWYKVLSICDEDGSGRLDYEELVKVIRRRYPGLNISSSVLSDEDLRGVWKAMDTDQSGQVSIQEFMIFAKRYGTQRAPEPPGSRFAGGAVLELNEEDRLYVIRTLETALKCYFNQRGLRGRHGGWEHFFQECGADRYGRIDLDQFVIGLRQRLLTLPGFEGSAREATPSAVVPGVGLQELRALWRGFEEKGTVSAKDWSLGLYRLELDSWPEASETILRSTVRLLKTRSNRIHLSPENWYGVFCCATDHLPTMNFEELKSLVRSHHMGLCLSPHQLPLDRLRMLWRALDTGRMGFVSRGSFIAFMRRYAAPQVKAPTKDRQAQVSEARKIIADGLANVGVESLRDALESCGAEWTGYVSEWDWQHIARYLLEFTEEQLGDDALHGVWVELDHKNEGELEAELVLERLSMQSRMQKSDGSTTLTELLRPGTESTAPPSTAASNSFDLVRRTPATPGLTGLAPPEGMSGITSPAPEGEGDVLPVASSLTLSRGATHSGAFHKPDGLFGEQERPLRMVAERLAEALIAYLYKKGVHCSTTIAGWYRFFSEIDADNSGRATFEEMEGAFQRCLSSARVSRYELLMLWRRLDADGSGEVSLDEFVKLMYTYELSLWPRSSDQELQRVVAKVSLALSRWHHVEGNWYKVFLLIDTQGTGIITFEDLHKFLRGTYPGLHLDREELPSDDMFRLWKALDTTARMRVPKSAFMSFMRRHGSPTKPMAKEPEPHVPRRLTNAPKKLDEPTEPRLPNFMALFRRKQAKKSQLQAASAVQAAQAVVDGLSCYTVEQLMMAYDHWGLPWTGVVSEWEWQLLARRLLGYDQDHLDDTALHGMWTCIDQQLTGHVAAGDLLQMMRVGQRRVKEPRTHTWQDLSIDVPHPDEHSSAMSAKQEKLWSEATYWRSAWWTSHLRQAQGLLPKVGA